MVLVHFSESRLGGMCPQRGGENRRLNPVVRIVPGLENSLERSALILFQRQGPPGFHVFVNECPSWTVRTGRARKVRMASITTLNSVFST